MVVVKQAVDLVRTLLNKSYHARLNIVIIIDIISQRTT